MTDADVHVDEAASAVAYAQMATSTMFDLAAPQPRYLDVIAQGGYVEVMDGLALSFSRANTEYVLRHARAVLVADRHEPRQHPPADPAQRRSAEHSKYRKLLDPLFAPKRMDEQEADITRRVNDFIDAFIDRGECNFSEEFAELFPSSVFLGLMGLPGGRAAHVPRHPRRHPAPREDRSRTRCSTCDDATDGDERRPARRSTSTSATSSTSARSSRPTTSSRTSSTVEIDGEKLTRDEILDICFLFLIAGLDTVSDSLTCSYAFLAKHPEHRQMIVDDPSIIPVAVEELLRWESPVPTGVPRIAKARSTCRTARTSPRAPR